MSDTTRLLTGTVSAVAGAVATVTVLGTGSVKGRVVGGSVGPGEAVDLMQAGKAWLVFAKGSAVDLSGYATHLEVQDRERAYTTEPTSTSWNDITGPGPWPKLMHGVNNPNGPNDGAVYYYLHNYVYSGTKGVALPDDQTSNNLTQWAVPYGNNTTAAPYMRHRYGGTWTAWKEVTVNSVARAGDTMSGGLSFGSSTVSGTDVSRHIALYGSTYGFNVTSGALNIVHGGAVVVAQAGTAQLQLRSSGINYLTATGVTGASNAVAMRWSSPNINGGVDNVNTCVLGTVSARRWKSAITTLKRGALDKVKRLRPVEYTPNELDGRPTQRERHHGLITDEVRRVLPGAVSGPGEGDAVNYLEVVPLLVAAIQELSDEVDLLKARAT